MNKMHDPELELLKRTVDLADYAKRAGYELRPQDGALGLTVLDHPNRDRIVVGQHPNGQWVYASVPAYSLRAPSETEVERRLREWRDAQAAIERRQAAREVQPPAPPAPQPAPLPKGRGRAIPGHPPADRAATTVSPGKSALGRRRYDWTPAPPDLDALLRGPRGPSGGRER